MVLQGCSNKDVTLFTLESSVFFRGEGKTVKVKINKEDKAILIKKLKTLHTIEAANRRNGFMPFFLSSYNYYLVVENKKQTAEFMIRDRTWIGNTTVYHFNAKNLISKETWDVVDEHLRTSYDNSVDTENKKTIDTLSDISSYAGNNR